MERITFILQRALAKVEGRVEWACTSHLPWLLWCGFVLAVALAGLVLTNAFCLFDDAGCSKCGFKPNQLIAHYPGKGAALQFAGTGMLFSLLLLIVGASGMYGPVREQLGPIKTAFAGFFTVLGYLFSLAGAYTDFAHHNETIALTFALPLVLIMPLYAIIFGLIMGSYLLLQGLLGTLRICIWFSNHVSRR